MIAVSRIKGVDLIKLVTIECDPMPTELLTAFIKLKLVPLSYYYVEMAKRKKKDIGLTHFN